MKKTSIILMALALSLTAGASFAKGKDAYPACKGLKGKDRSACVKSEKAKAPKAPAAATAPATK
jgi:hypothetical protein